jgi:4-amino-4-deoxy-L-arabinose transferase-like glycosyltransferase
MPSRPPPHLYQSSNGETNRVTVIEFGIGATLVLLLLGLKWFYVCNQPWDSDEPQHLHVVWAWASGLLPYRDVFDNHAPFFQAISAPVFAMLGERADIVMCMRWAMLPIDILILFLLYRLGKSLFSQRIGLWGTMIAAAFPDFYFKMGEYRPDLFWTALWLLLLNLLVGGSLSPRRLFSIGIVCGLAFTVSMKTAFLLLTLLIGGLVGWSLGQLLPKSKSDYPRSTPDRFFGILTLIGGALIFPVLVVAFFAGQNALNQLYYCVIAHNLMPGEEPWNALMVHRMRDSRFWLFVLTLGGGWWLAKRDENRARGRRRLFFFAVVGFYCTILFSFWPLVSKQDFIPYFPIVSMAIAVPLVMLAERFHSIVPAYAAPACVAIGELVWLVTAHPPLKDTNRKNVQLIADALKLTQAGETVLDAKGQTIFRPRPFFYVLEQITRERVEQGKLQDDTPERLVAYKTAVVVDAHWLTLKTGEFISQNYVPVGSLMVLGKKLPSSAVGKIGFDIAIPEKYAIVSESGLVGGTLDGAKLEGWRDMAAGHHEFIPDALSNL